MENNKAEDRTDNCQSSGAVVRCADCKHWDNSNTYNVLGEAEKNYGNCNSSAFSYENISDERTDMLIYADYEGYSAGFDTGKDFACIHAEKRI